MATDSTAGAAGRHGRGSGLTLPRDRDTSPPGSPATSVRAEAERAGFRDDCDRCRYAFAAGREACAIHYIPTGKRGVG